MILQLTMKAKDLPLESLLQAMPIYKLLVEEMEKPSSEAEVAAALLRLVGSTAHLGIDFRSFHRSMIVSLTHYYLRRISCRRSSQLDC